jgi:hypothetical protein
MRLTDLEFNKNKKNNEINPTTFHPFNPFHFQSFLPRANSKKKPTGHILATDFTMVGPTSIPLLSGHG